MVEKGAGSPSHFSDADYEAAGAKVVDAGDVWKSDIVMKVSAMWDYKIHHVLSSYMLSG